MSATVSLWDNMMCELDTLMFVKLISTAKRCAI